MPKKLTYNGKSSTDLGLVIQTTPVYNVPKRDVSTTHVPGRNGDIVVDNGCYENVKREYSLAKTYELPTASLQGTVLNAQAIYEWLTSAKGKYVELEDDYDPTVYRLATFVGGNSIGDIFDKAFTYMAEFNCKPQRFLKSGKTPVVNAPGPTATINNLFHYEAKPIIKIENLPYGGTETTMLSVKSLEDGILKEKCLITLRDLNEDEIVYIDSENENCYNGEDQEINNKVALNGNNFPKLLKGNNVISVDQYERVEYDDIPSYETVLQEKQIVVSSIYSPKETTIASFEDEYKIKSYSSLINEKEHSFNGDSFQTRLTELCDKNITVNRGDKIIDLARSYTIESFTTAISSDTITISFPNFTFSDYLSEFKVSDLYKYCELESISSDNGYKVKVREHNYIWVLDGNKIIRKGPGSEIISRYSSGSGSIDKTFYLANFEIGWSTAQDIKNNPDAQVGIRYNIGNSETGTCWMLSSDGTWSSSVRNTGLEGIIAADHINETLPNWLKLAVAYDTSDNYTITNVDYYLELSDYADSGACFYWTEKIGLIGLFGKAGWHKYIEPTEGNAIIITYKWDRLKKGFVPNGSLVSKVTASTNIRFVATNETESATLLQYDFGLNSLELFRTDVVSSITDMSQIKLYALQKGYYKVNDGYWVECNVDAQIGSTFAANKSIEVHFLKEIPTWKNEADWPSWLNPTPVPIYTTTPSIYRILLNANQINYKVQQETWYRLWTVTDETRVPGAFTYHYIDEYINEDSSYLLSDNITITRYYCTVEGWEDPSDIPAFPNDRAFSINNGTPSGSSPSYLRYNLSMIVKFDANPDTKIEMRRESGADYPSQNPTHYCWVKVGQSTDTPGSTVCFTTKPFMNVNERVTKAIYEHGGYEPDIGTESGKIDEEASFVFYSGNSQGGFYKYDNSTAWVKHATADTTPIVKINYKDDVTFYYLETLPEYSEYYPSGEEPEWLDLFNIDHLPADENPLNIRFKIKNGKAGYYKLSTSTNWKYYAAGEEFANCLVNERLIISHLVASEDTSALDEVIITITPNWWLL